MTANGETAAAILLVVDDEPNNVDLLRLIVEESGLAVRFEAAHNGSEGVERVRALHPRLVLMDLKMPVVDGLEATRRLKSDPATAAIPIIALTAQAMRGDADRARAAGCDGYLTKPVEMSAVVALLAEHFA